MHEMRGLDLLFSALFEYALLLMNHLLPLFLSDPIHADNRRSL